jgi:hypothetical protein
MSDKEKLRHFFESELNGFSSNFLFRDKQLLNEEKFSEFARELLKRSKKSYRVMIASAVCFVIIGILYQSNLIVPGSPMWIGVAYLSLGMFWIAISTRDYYRVRGSMTLLLILQDTESQEPKVKTKSETALAETRI